MSCINPYAKSSRKRRLDDVVEVQEQTNQPQVPTKDKGIVTFTSTTKETSNEMTVDTVANNNLTTASTKDVTALVIAASDKAGMEGIDRARINEIILRESKDSLYMQQQRKRDEKTNQRIQQLKSKLDSLTKELFGTVHAKPPQDNPVTSSDDSCVVPCSKERKQEVDATIDNLISNRPTRSTKVVVDMDMFFMACELLSHPNLPKDQPACVGGSMISTSNYAARRFGVRSAMAGWIGDKLVEELSNGKYKLLHFKSNFALYKEKSAIVRKVLSEYDPHLTAYSLDEAYMDIGPYLALKFLNPHWNHGHIRQYLQKSDRRDDNTEGDVNYASKVSEALENIDDHDRTMVTNGDSFNADQDIEYPEISIPTKSPTWYLEVLADHSPNDCRTLTDKIVQEMRHKVCDATGGLTCSAGIAPNVMLAKIASDRNKPNGQMIVRADSHADIIEFLHPLPTRKVSGIGRVTEKILNAFDITTVGDLYARRYLVHLLFKPSSANFLIRASVGCNSISENDDCEDEENGPKNDNEDEEDHHQKGISRERTFSSGRPWNEILSRLEDIAQLLSSDMRRKQLHARTITLKVKLHTFDALSRSRSMPEGVFLQKSEHLIEYASKMLFDIRHEHGQCKSKAFSVRLLGIRCSNLVTNPPSHVTVDRFFQKQKSPLKSRERRCDASNDTRTSTHRFGSSPNNSHMATKEATGSLHPAFAAFRTIDKTTMCRRPELSSSPLPPSKATCKERDKTEVTPESPADTSMSAEASSTMKTPDDEEMVHCPLCRAAFPVSANGALNRHVDSCLSGQTVRSLLRKDQAKSTKRSPTGSAKLMAAFLSTETSSS